MMIEEGTVRRNDLNLRLKYIGLVTEIYQIETYKFVIYYTNYKGNFGELAKDFDYSIKQAGTNIVLTEQRPSEFRKKINNIPLSNVVDGFKATCITEGDLNNFIRSKFYDVDIRTVTVPKTGVDFEILIEVSMETEEQKIAAMETFLLNSDLGTDKIAIIKANTELKELSNEETPKIGSKSERFNQWEKANQVMNLSLEKDLPFMIAEADYWFEYAEDIYNGKLTRNDLCFYRGESLKCFLDFSVFDNIDLRNVLLLYDTVYLALPIEEHLVNFLERQNMNIPELLELIDMGKVVLLLPNLETRYDKNLLLEAYRCNPNGIVSRRGINALIAAYLVETKLQYEKRFPNIYDIASDVFMKGVEQGNSNIQNIARLIAWPITATADSFRYLNHHSPMSISNFGINDIITKNIGTNDDGGKISFEFTMNSTSTHIAAALQSTYFPFLQYGDDGSKYSDAGVSNIVGDLLKLYWYDADNLQNINNLYRESTTNYLKFFECKHNIKVTKVASLADDYKTQIGFRSLLARLDKMDEKLRKDQIMEYNNLLFEVGKIQNSQSDGFLKFMLGSTGFLPLSYSLSFILSAIGLIKDRVDHLESIRKSAEMKAIEECIENYGGIPCNKQSVEEIYLLDKISRVAILK